MQGFYTLVLAWDDQTTQPQLRIVQTASTIEALRVVQDYDPVGPFTTVARDQFTRTRIEGLCCKVWSSARASGFDGRVG